MLVEHILFHSRRIWRLAEPRLGHFLAISVQLLVRAIGVNSDRLLTPSHTAVLSAILRDILGEVKVLVSGWGSVLDDVFMIDRLLAGLIQLELVAWVELL